MTRTDTKKTSEPSAPQGVVVVGVGQWGKNLARSFHQLGLLRGFCDQDVLMLHALLQTYPLAKAYLWEEIFQDHNVRGVVLAVPSPLHFSMACHALEQGKDVFIEKPVVFSMEELNTLKHLAQKHKAIVMGGHLLRYHPAFEEIVRWVERNQLGPLHYIYAQRENFGRVVLGERNALWSLGCHDLSLILALSQRQPETMSLQHSGVYTPRDCLNVQLIFSHGLMAQLACSWIAPIKKQVFWVRGTKGVLFWDNTHSCELIFYPQEMTSHGLTKRDPIPVPFDSEQPLLRECRHFWSCLQTRIPPTTDLWEIQQVTELLVRLDHTKDSHLS